MKHHPTSTRRTLLGAAAATAVIAPLHALPSSPAPSEGDPSALKVRLAMASYSLREFPLEQALSMTKRLELDAIGLKAFHLALDADEATIAAALEKTKEAGITIYGGGVINLRNEAEVNRAFDYAKAAGMKRIISSPAMDMLPLIEKKVREYDVEVAIHNHGPTDPVWPSPELTYDKIAGLDRRIGFCHDIGHTTRLGRDAVAETRKCADRILDVHMKDVSGPTIKGRTVPCGCGMIDLPALLRTLVEVGYAGYLAFEYESEGKDPLPGIAQAVGYVRGVLDEMAARGRGE